MSELIKKHLTKSDIASIERLQQAIKAGTITITCLGLCNHGKSTLLNTLIKDLNNETFKTADVRETSVNKTIEFERNKFVDTPGLNAKIHDDKRVMDAVKDSDINLFVHTVTTGEFVEKEVDFLKKIKKHWKNPQEFIERTVFVVSRIDKADNEKDVLDTIEKMSKQIIEIFNTAATIVPVSAKRYQEGVRKNKGIMVSKSNIEELEERIGRLSDELSDPIKETRKKRLRAMYSNLIRRFSSNMQEYQLEISKVKRVEKDYSNALSKEILKTDNTLKRMYSKIGA